MRTHKPTDTDIAAALADLDALPDDGPRVCTDNWPGYQHDDIAAVLQSHPWPYGMSIRTMSTPQFALRFCRLHET